ncbi:MAG: F0F1 ATP synthase subunit B [Fibrobacter sp.]|nr:F0F1 ATP synthase subunit B [Fibrobacter sp.]
MLEINPALFLSQMVTFLIALFIVWKIAWGPLQNLMKSRQDNIRENLQQAEQTRQAAARLEEDYRYRLSQIEQQTKELFVIAKLEGNRLRDEIVTNAQKEVSEMHKRSQEQLELEKEYLLRDLRTKVVELSLSLSGRIIKEQDISGYSASQLDGMLDILEKKEA